MKIQSLVLEQLRQLNFIQDIVEGVRFGVDQSIGKSKKRVSLRYEQFVIQIVGERRDGVLNTRRVCVAVNLSACKLHVQCAQGTYAHTYRSVKGLCFRFNSTDHTVAIPK